MRADSLILSGLSLVLLAACGCTQDLTTGLDEDARQAIEIGCRDRPGDARRTCEQTLARLYLAGRLDPDKTLRAWCLRVKDSRWAGPPPAPPPLCQERYGGWPTGPAPTDPTRVALAKDPPTE
ncbi:MAG TPA: hypothetical protein PLW10_04930 [Myxococcota bacterium]|nr:hypothetical protein [Myxococcales bacterium]HPG24957.1 hypothetical protein [Myxococcota bacterium]